MLNLIDLGGIILYNYDRDFNKIDWHFTFHIQARERDSYRLD